MLTRILDVLLGQKCPVCHDRSRRLFAHLWLEHAGEVTEVGDPRPCKGGNSNICVAEGCYGESCRGQRS